MIGRILCWLGLHKSVIYNHENLWQIEKCARCSLVSRFEKTTDEPLVLAVGSKILPLG